VGGACKERGTSIIAHCARRCHSNDGCLGGRAMNACALPRGRSVLLFMDIYILYRAVSFVLDVEIQAYSYSYPCGNKPVSI